MQQGKIGLVTGAGSGIGRAAAQALAAAGVTGMALVDLDSAALATVAQSLQGLGVRVLARSHNVSDADAWSESENAIREVFGGLDVAVANAGVAHGAAIV